MNSIKHFLLFDCLFFCIFILTLWIYYRYTIVSYGIYRLTASYRFCGKSPEFADACYGTIARPEFADVESYSHYKFCGKAPGIADVAIAVRVS